MAHGETLRECAAFVTTLPQTIAVGINCTAPALITPLIAELRAATGKPILAYPNSGEVWDAQARRWAGSSAPAAYGEEAAKWFAAGAQIVGGCCRTRPAHIQQVSQAAARAQSGPRLA